MAATKIRNEQLNVDSNLDVGSHNIINVTDPTTAQQAATKNYVDAQIASNVQGLVQKPTANAITTAALPACTYSNGSSGVGATLTGTANGALSAQDGVTLTVNQLLLVNNQASAFQNGLYTLTTVGTGSVPFVLTRHVDMDDATEFLGSLLAIATGGTTYGGTLWLCAVTTSPFVPGTTSVTWSEITAASISAANPTATIGTSAVDGVATTFMRSDAAPAFGNLTGDVTSTGMATTVATVDGSTAANVHAAELLANAATNLDTVSTIVKRDSSGDFSAGTITANLTGNASGSAATITGSLTGDVTSTGMATTIAMSTVLAAHLATRETPSGTINGSNTAFTLAHTPISGTESVYLNGQLLNAGSSDYSISTNTITMVIAPVSGDSLRSTYFY